ncbi:MAG: hypothetical protein IPK76_03805 [Lewinellaceae bacterium]|nr:hypothetical protein [Lewinellaceae bacterium]
MWAQPVFSQYLQVQSLTIADGLSQGFVTSIFEDSRGFIWIGTLQGLNRYDGYQVKRFVLDNQNKWALKASYIHAITEDKNGLLWIGTDKGPVILDPYTERFVLLSDIISDLPNQPSITITENKGNIWVVSEKSGKDGLYVVRPPAQLTKMIRDGQLRSSAFSVRFLKLNAEHIAFRSKLFRINDSIITGIDEQGRLYKIDPNSLQIRETDARTLNFEPIGASGFYYPQDKSRGQIIIPSGNNLPEILWPHWLKGAYMKLPNGKRVFFRTADPNLYKLPPEVPGQYELNLNDSEPVLNLEQLVRLDKVCSESCLIDRNGNMWVGTTGYGVRKISEPLLKYRQILPNQSIYNFVMLPDGRIWPGIYKTLEVFNPKNGAYEVAPWTLAQPNTWGYSLLISKDETWWMACRTRQELFITKKAPGSSNWQKLKVQLNILEDIPVQLLEDKQGFIWMSGNEGQIVRIHPKTNQVDTWNVQGYFPKTSPPPCAAIA